MMAPRSIFAAFSVALGLAIILAVATTVKNAPSARAGTPIKHPISDGARRIAATIART
jgi:hypothetical protein